MLVGCLSTWSIAQPAGIQGPVDLHCEYLLNPLGVDEPAPRLLWKLSDQRRGARQTAYEIFVDKDAATLGQQGKGMWHSGKVASSASLVSYAGKKLERGIRYYWTVKVWDENGLLYKRQPIAYFETGIGINANWKGAWISDGAGIDVKPAPYFRTTFEPKKKIRSARAYIAAAGLYELYVNGLRVGDHRLDPAYTRFDRRTHYLTHDVTAAVVQGKNAVGVLLGNGWYNHQSTAVWDFHRAPWRARPVFCMDLRITYDDGSTETITTGKNWKTNTGAIIFNSIYTAEHVDASRELTGWSTAGYDDKGWKEIVYRAAPSQNVVSQQIHPIRATDTIKARSMQRFSDSLYVFDLGRNIAGVSRITVKAAAGTTLRLKHGERLYPNGRVDLSNIDVHYRPTGTDDPFQTDIVTLAGGSEESFMPHFNYKGFQYVEVVSSAPVTLTSDNLVGYFMHSDVPAVGSIQSSDPVINGIWKAANNSYLSNLHGYPTDCPQREKNGWTGDAHIAIETGLYNFDAITIYEKWMADHRDEQQPNGVLPSIIPTGGWGYEWGNGPDWTSTIALIPWNVYLFYGDTKLLALCYDNIRRYVDHINDRYPSGLTSWGLGDWVPVKSKSPVEFTSSGYYLTDVRILAKAAKLLKRAADYNKYTQLAKKIQDAINAKYLDRATGLYGKGTQTEMSFPLHWKIVPENMIKTVADNLARRVEADSVTLDVGLLGTKTILNALSDNGHAELAFRLASKRTYPSWGWWIVNGATTLYENWKIDSRNDISLNHIMFGEVGAWLYKGLGGIKPLEQAPGFKTVSLEPHFVAGLDSFVAVYNSPKGSILSSWKRVGNALHYTTIIPANSLALLKLSLPVGTNITEAQKPVVAGARGIISRSIGDGKVELKIEAGEYHFIIE